MQQAQQAEQKSFHACVNQIIVFTRTYMRYEFMTIYALVCLFGCLMFKKPCGRRHDRVLQQPVHYCGHCHHHMWVCLHMLPVTAVRDNEGNTSHGGKCDPTHLHSRHAGYYWWLNADVVTKIGHFTDVHSFVVVLHCCYCILNIITRAF